MLTQPQVLMSLGSEVSELCEVMEICHGGACEVVLVTQIEDKESDMHTPDAVAVVGERREESTYRVKDNIRVVCGRDP